MRLGRDAWEGRRWRAVGWATVADGAGLPLPRAARRASTVFGEDRRRAGPTGRAPASWGNPSAYSSRTGRTEPTITIGKRLAERIRANVTSGVAESCEIRSNLEWQLSPRVSVEGSYDNVNDISSSSLGNLGADVRWRMEFE